MFGFKKQTLRQKRLARRKKHLHQLIARLSEKKAILELEIEETEKHLDKARFDLKMALSKEVKKDD